MSPPSPSILILRHPVGKKTLSGYITLPPKDAAGFGPVSQDRALEIEFGEAERITARLHATAGNRPQLVIAFTGEAGQALRIWLRRKAKTRKVRGPRGVLVLTQTAPDRFTAHFETLQQARVEQLCPGEMLTWAGARPIAVLHPAMAGLGRLLARITLAPAAPLTGEGLRQEIARALGAEGWGEVPGTGAGLGIAGGLLRSSAQLHFAPDPDALAGALIALGAALEQKAIELGILLVPDEGLARRLSRRNPARAVFAEKVRQVLETLPYLVRGPLCLVPLGVVQTLR